MPRGLRIALSAIPCLFSAYAQAQGEPDYTFGPEDVMTVTVLRHPELSGDFLVTDAGYIQVPVAGTIKATGRTTPELITTITDRLKDRIKNPEVSVALKSARAQRIYVFGDVRTPGVYNLKPGWKLAQAISASGGISPLMQIADIQVTLERDNQEPITLPLMAALAPANAKRFQLKAGDVLRLEGVALRAVYVSGMVKTPGMYALRSDSRSILAAIATAGGVLPDAELHRVKIYRIDGTEQTVDLTGALVQGESSKLPSLETGDLIVVPQLTSRFAVLGWVTKPGYYPIPSGKEYLLSDAVALSGGSAIRGRLSRVGVISEKDGKSVIAMYDLGKFFRFGDVTQNPAIKPGDLVFVPETNRVELATILSAISATSTLVIASKR
jgi:polysaccharide export outer membrane protein